MPVARQVLEHARARPDRVALRSPARTRTYEDLAADIDVTARALWSRGLRAHHVAAIDFIEPVDLLTALLAADLIGAVPLVLDAQWPAEQRASVLEAIAPDLHVHASPTAEQPTSAAFQAAPSYEPWLPEPDDLAWAGFSSGSTGRPRAIVRTRASWTSSFPAVEKLTGLSSSDAVLVPGPLASSLFCFAALHGLAAGAEVLVTGRWSGKTVAGFLDDADVVHAVPHMLEHILTQLAGRSTPSRTPAMRPRVVMVGGAALPSRVRDRAAALGMDVVAYYGAVELSFVAVDDDGRGLRPFDDVAVDVRPVGGSETPGEVWVRSPWVAEGYLAGVTGPFRRDDTGSVTVGDLAEISDDSRLTLRGRGDGAIVTGGATVVPEDVEAVLAQVAGVAAVVVVGTPHVDLGAVVTALIEPAAEPVSRALLESVARRHLTTAQRPRRWFAIEQLPRTATGKPARAAITEGLRRGTLQTRPLPRENRA